jgi:hypothetical protein
MESDKDDTFDMSMFGDEGEENFLDFDGNEGNVNDVAKQFLQIRWNKLTTVVPMNFLLNHSLG